MGQNYRELKVWQRSMELVRDDYQVTKAFPKDETYGLTSQIRRAAVSVPSNIAEGQSRHSHKEFMRFLSASRGSLSEVETQIMIAQMLGYIDKATTDRSLESTAEIGRMLNGLYESIRARVEN